MWPVYVAQLAEAMLPEARPLVPGTELVLERQTLYRAMAWPGAGARKHDVLFVVERAMAGEVTAALDRGAMVVVPPSLAETITHEEHRRRTFVARDPVAAFRRFASFMRSRFGFPVIAVGGSNGKTTTKELITAALSGAGRRITATPGTNNGWVGTPTTLCHPWHTEPSPDALVLEIGIDEQGAMAKHVALARPDIAVLTALGIEHLAGLGTHQEVIREELELFRAKRRVWLASDPHLHERLDEVRAEDIVVHDRESPVAIDAGLRLAYAWRSTSGGGELEVEANGETRSIALPLPGEHNGRNAALALATALLLGRTLDEAITGLASFEAPKQRCSVTRFPSGSILVDDTYNASPSSFEAALDVLASLEPTRPRVLVLGDMLDLGAATTRLHEALVPKLDQISNAHVRLYGEAMAALAPRFSSARSVGLAREDQDPTSLLDIPTMGACVVLVKGSRGMRLERVVERMNELERSTLVIGITGVDAEAFATMLAARLAAGNVRASVSALTPTELEDPAFAARHIDLAILTGFVPDETDGADAERMLAATAQLFVRLSTGARAILARVDATDEAPDLLASIIGQVSGCADTTPERTLTTSRSELAACAFSTAISMAHERDRRK